LAPRKLYLPYGTLPGVSGTHALMVHWFRVDREVPLDPYERLLLGYRTLTDEARSRAEAMVNEFLSEDEFHELREYLQRQRGTDLRTTVLVAPVSATRPDAATRTGGLRPFAQCEEDPHSGSGFFRMSEQDGYPLSFAVWGYHAGVDQRYHPPVSPAQKLSVPAPRPEVGT